MLYVPRGEAHDAVGEVKPSVHLTIGIIPPTGIDLLNWMAQRAKNDVAFRMDLSRVGGEEPLRNHGLVLKRHLHELIDQLSFDAFLDDVDQQRSLRARLNLGSDNALRPDTWLSPTPKRRIALAPDTKGETEVTFGGRVFRLSANARRTLHLLLEQDGLSFGALAEKLATTVEDNGLREAVAQLVAKGLVAVESDETPTCHRKRVDSRLAVGRLEEERSLVDLESLLGGAPFAVLPPTRVFQPYCSLTARNIINKRSKPTATMTALNRPGCPTIVRI